MSMGGGYELVLALNGSCSGCFAELGPPPDSILLIPPPPLPVYLQAGLQALLATHENDTDTPKQRTPCTSPCEWPIGSTGVDFVELPRQGPTLDETWFLVLISSSVGVLVLGALLALFLLKCRVGRGGKASLQLDVSGLATTKSCEAVLYPCAGNLPGSVGTPDSRVLWAALTPRGGTTHHLISSPGGSPEYEEPACLVNTKTQSLVGKAPSHHHQSSSSLYQAQSFDNSGFVGSDEPLVATPTRIDSYLELMEAGTAIKRGSPRRLVSSPTRIEHPNLPPLNLLPHRSLRRLAPPSRRSSDAGPAAVIL